MQNILDTLFLKYGTDKSSKSHNYASVYHAALEALRFSICTVLEIGIFGTTPENAGASLKAWAEYFPNATIYGVDLHDYSFLETDRIKTIVADQALIPNNLEMVANITGGALDLIIDDGGHEMQQQQITLSFMFKLLRPGGCYIIEDLQTSYHKAFNPDDTFYTTVLMLELFKHTGKLYSDYISEADRLYLQQQIATCDLYRVVPGHSETALLWKRSEDFR